MSKLQSYVLSKFSLIDRNIDVVQLINIFKDDNSEFSSGFQVVNAQEINNGSLKVEIVKRSPTYLFDFDLISRELIKKESFIYSVSHFEVNLFESYLLIYGGLSQNTDVKLFLKRVGIEFDIEQLYIDISRFFSSTSLKYKNILLKGISIKKFNYRNGVVGRFSGEIVDSAIVNDLLTDYSKDLLKATFTINDEDVEFDLQIFPNGAFKILTYQEDQRGVLNNVINSLLI